MWSRGELNSDLRCARAASSRWTTAPRSVRAAGIEPAWTWFRARWPAIDPHPDASSWVTGGDRTLTCAFTARRAVPLHHGHHSLPSARFPELGSNERLRFQRPPSCRLDDPGSRGAGWSRTSYLPLIERALFLACATAPCSWCSRLESNQHLLRFRQAPSPDRLREHLRGRGGARPRASSTIGFSKSSRGSGMRTRTSISGVKVRGPAVGRSPKGGSGGNRTPFARVRAECFAIKASVPLPCDRAAVPSVGLEPTQSDLKGRCPSCWVSTANDSRGCVCVSRMHAPRSESGDRSSLPCARPSEMKKAAVVSQGGFKRTNETFAL
jgi:hypothetical protein